MIPFTKPYLSGKEIDYIKEAQTEQLSGNGRFTKLAESYLKIILQMKKGDVLLTNSGTSALEMSALLLDIKPGDEVIMPSFTFVSTANSFALRGAKIVFCDIEKNTLCIDPEKIELLITNKTKAIVAVHYAGVPCDMTRLWKVAGKYNLNVVEDAAMALGSKHGDRFLGTCSELGIVSFHDTKNVTCGEGGALIVNSEKYLERAQIIREKGTDRKKFFDGKIDKYTWQDIGSSYIPSEINAAYLCAQLESFKTIQEKRKDVWDFYYNSFKDNTDFTIGPHILVNHNYHMFYLLTKEERTRNNLIHHLKSNQIEAHFHYVPLHLSSAGKKFGIQRKSLVITEDVSSKIIRLPLYPDLNRNDQEKIVKAVNDFYL